MLQEAAGRRGHGREARPLDRWATWTSKSPGNGRAQGEEGRARSQESKRRVARRGPARASGGCQSRIGKDACEEGHWTVPSLPNPHLDLCLDLAGAEAEGGSWRQTWGLICGRPEPVSHLPVPPPGSSCTNNWGRRSRVRPRPPQEGWSPQWLRKRLEGEGPGTSCLASSSLSFPREEEPMMSASFMSQQAARCPQALGSPTRSHCDWPEGGVATMPLSSTTCPHGPPYFPSVGEGAGGCSTLPAVPYKQRQLISGSRPPYKGLG